MAKILLVGGEWEYRPKVLLGSPGGFGTVFDGKGKHHGQVAVKRLHLRANDVSHRELRIAAELSRSDLKHIIPILDSGKDANTDYYFIVMEKAEKSLQDELKNKGKFTEQETIPILQSIATGLSEVPKIIHRDLKPSNILFHDNRWKVADFGIGRFIEESTSAHTLKEYLSPEYAAPEQWKIESAKSATDIYALGCVAYALLTGNPPFQGPGREDYKIQHIQEEPLPLTDEFSPRLRSLLSMMLRKLPQARPSLDRVLQTLSTISSELHNRKGLQNLAQVGAIDAELAVRSDAAYSEKEEKNRIRKELATTAFQILKDVTSELAKMILDAAPTVRHTPHREWLVLLEFGSASMKIEPLIHRQPVPENALSHVMDHTDWDVVAGAAIFVEQKRPRPFIWGANLWYTDLGKGEEYRWWEIPYMSRYPTRNQPVFQPFAVTLEQAMSLDTGGMIRRAATPRYVDDENTHDFCERWAELLAKAYKGELEYPRYLPLD